MISHLKIHSHRILTLGTHGRRGRGLLSHPERAGVDIEALQSWVGRFQAADDVAVPGPLAGLAALLDHSTPPWTPGELPPLSHWLYFLPRERQSLLDRDGHAKRGDLLPPVPLPRRMWVGSRVRFLARIPLAAAMRRRSTILRVTAKHGRSGAMVFVTIKHEISTRGGTAIIEEQDLVFRSEPPTQPRAGAPRAPLPDAAASANDVSRVRPSDAKRSLSPDPALLFRFSALTFNAHRIHYDRDYAREVEGYAGLVVHGPLVATLLMDLFLRHSPGAVVRSFSFRAERPLLDTVPFDLCLAVKGSGAELWAIDAADGLAYSANVDC
jgi:3-methylfumaryl-CoA hydratase